MDNAPNNPNPLPGALCIYHANCADGFGAAWVVRKAFQRDGIPADYLAAQYGHEPPDVRDRNVILVDFSYKRPVLEAMAQDARSIIVLDHHKTAAEDLAGFWPVEPWDRWLNTNHQAGHIWAQFDMARSGAGMAWDYFFPREPRPNLIDHIEDRDLWKFTIPGTREIQTCVVSWPFNFDIWDTLVADAEDWGKRHSMFNQGAAIDRKLQQDIASILATPPRRMKIGGIDVPVVNAPGMWASDMAGKMAQTEPFAAIYFDTPTERVFSLRSRGEGGADVSAIAKQYGGGGHKNAAGFQVPHGWEGDPA